MENICRFEVHKEFFPPETFEAIKSRLVQSELAMAPNALAADNFGEILMVQLNEELNELILSVSVCPVYVMCIKY